MTILWIVGYMLMGAWVIFLVVGAWAFRVAVHRIPGPEEARKDLAWRLAWLEVEDVCAAQGVNARGELVRQGKD